MVVDNQTVKISSQSMLAKTDEKNPRRLEKLDFLLYYYVHLSHISWMPCVFSQFGKAMNARPPYWTSIICAHPYYSVRLYLYPPLALLGLDSSDKHSLILSLSDSKQSHSLFTLQRVYIYQSSFNCERARHVKNQNCGFDTAKSSQDESHRSYYRCEFYLILLHSSVTHTEHFAGLQVVSDAHSYLRMVRNNNPIKVPWEALTQSIGTRASTRSQALMAVASRTFWMPFVSS